MSDTPKKLRRELEAVASGLRTASSHAISGTDASYVYSKVRSLANDLEALAKRVGKLPEPEDE
jgi:ubiquinone biosynthesis protein UbiJ